ncbi:MAG: hypothetical protein K9L70_08645 [Thiohalocapsa sp.]|jgi:hypothetical protein|nr:hypothetical protein [Thiohalocapsa sp.]MCF7992689.1 hypothetical protein [Thiohalocapsa sp.]
MSGVLKTKGDPLWKRKDDPGYRVGWRSKAKFEKGHLDGEMTYGEAEKKAAELAAKDTEKTYYPELIIIEDSAA